MVLFRPEEVTLPSRFICKICHLVAVLTILFDVSAVVGHMEQIPASASLFKTRSNQIKGITYASIGLFAVDFLSLFLGISMFFPVMMSFNIIAHFVGTILTVLFYVDHWSFGAYIAFFVLFIILPVLLELLVLVFVTKFSFLKY